MQKCSLRLGKFKKNKKFDTRALLRALHCHENMKNHENCDFSWFWARIFEISARAKNFIKNEFSEQCRWLLHLESKNYLKNSFLKLTKSSLTVYGHIRPVNVAISMSSNRQVKWLKQQIKIKSASIGFRFRVHFFFSRMRPGNR